MRTYLVLLKYHEYPGEDGLRLWAGHFTEMSRYQAGMKAVRLALRDELPKDLHIAVDLYREGPMSSGIRDMSPAYSDMWETIAQFMRLSSIP